jgi:DsbC/DsbD-like thiol-disulfide interchange protein
MAVMPRFLPLVFLFSLVCAHAAEREIEGKHLRVALNQSRDSVPAGGKVTLTAQVKLPPGMHVYAPPIEPPYKPIKLSIDSPKGMKVSTVRYPEGKKLHLQAIGETVPVYEGSVTLEASASVLPTAPPGDTVINGTLNYQTCDDKICYLPVTLPVTWTVKVTPSKNKETTSRK